MPILVGIDGTGDAIAPGKKRDADYDLAFKDSFVSRICAGKAHALYQRGPVMLGGGLLHAIETGVAFIVEKHKYLPKEPVLLTGYSRGATGVVAIAKRLKKRNINVRAMMLFDCVDRHVAVDAYEVPNNVEYVNHVMRDPAARSRMTFSNDALAYSHPTVYLQPKHYLCTHGGMGGMPWRLEDGKGPNDYIDEGFMEAVGSAPPWQLLFGGIPWQTITYRTNVTYANDARISKTVWRDVQPFLRKHNF